MKNITIVGVGALGSHVAMLLRNEGNLRLIDFDRVEQKNLLAQFHGKSGVGKLKVQALGAAMQFYWNVKPEQLHHRLDNSNVDLMLKGSDLVIDCVDNGDTRRVLQAYCRGRGEALLHGALAADGEFGRVIWDEQFVADDATGAGAATCDGGEHLPFIAIVSAYIARVAQIYLKTGGKVGFSITNTRVIPT